MSLFTSALLTPFYYIFVFQKNSCEGLDLNFLQKEYLLKPERAGVIRYNPKCVNYCNLSTFKYNRTTTAFNMSFNYKIDMEYDDLQIVLQAYKFASNEYRLFPLRFQAGFCRFFDNNVGGLNSASEKYRNFETCPLKKNTDFRFYNFAPDASKLPPFIPFGRYKVELQAVYKSMEAWKLYACAEVSYPVNKMEPTVNALNGVTVA